MKQSFDGATTRGILPLLALNFFMAGMQAGIGPFLGVIALWICSASILRPACARRPNGSSSPVPAVALAKGAR